MFRCSAALCLIKFYIDCDLLFCTIYYLLTAQLININNLKARRYSIDTGCILEKFHLIFLTSLWKIIHRMFYILIFLFNQLEKLDAAKNIFTTYKDF